MKKRGHGVLLLVNEKNRAKCAMETHVSKSGARPPDTKISRRFYVRTPQFVKRAGKSARPASACDEIKNTPTPFYR
jgi:hypothetical protein